MAKKANFKPRQRAWKPKTKTGCITCRIRRIKCDETKPECNKCTSTGRKCDGYSSASITENGESTSLSIARPNASGFSGTPEELEGWHHFQIYATSEYGDYISESSKFWAREVLRASQDYPAVRHAAIALGTMHRKFITGRETLVTADTADRAMRFALEQYNKSIQHTVALSGSNAPPERSITMTVCMLFTCLASIQGLQSQALIHLESGMKMLEELEDLQTSDPTVEDSIPVSLSCLRSIFEGFDLQARMSLSEEMLQVWHPRRILIPEPPPCFASISEALAFFKDMFYVIMLLAQDSDPDMAGLDGMSVLLDGADLDTDLPALVSIAVEEFRCRFIEAEAACARMLVKKSTTLTKNQSKALDVIAIYRMCIKIFFTLTEEGPAHPETSYDELEPELLELFNLSCTLYDVQPDGITATSDEPPSHEKALRSGAAGLRPLSTKERAPLYSFNPGPVEPLFVVASRSRCPLLRRRAINLMLRYPRREGIWDSVLAGRIAWESMTMEETLAEEYQEKQGLTHGIHCAADIPEECRTRDIALSFEGLRTATCVFRRTEHFLRGEPGIKRTISW